MQRLKEIDLDDINNVNLNLQKQTSTIEDKENNSDSDPKKDDEIDDVYVKKAVVDSNLDPDVKLYLLEKILNKKQQLQYPYQSIFIDRFDTNEYAPPKIYTSPNTTPLDVPPTFTCDMSNLVYTDQPNGLKVTTKLSN